MDDDLSDADDDGGAAAAALSQALRLTITPGQGGRLDKVLAAAWPDLSRARLQALMRQGHVSRDGATITDPSRPVKPGEVYDLALPPPVPAEPRPQAIPLAVVFEDDHLIVIDKPAGLVVHPAPGHADGTLVNALLAHCGASLSGIGGVARPGIVHRLDRDTSGLIVAAKTDRAHAGLAALFAAHDLERAYHALVIGVPRPAQGHIATQIGRDPRDRLRMAVVQGGGKPARTHYNVIAAAADGQAALVEFALETGRTHQVRVHAAHLGHPLVGDALYARGRRRAGPPLAQSLRLFPRQALHCVRLGFRHPVSAEWMLFRSDIAKDIRALIEELKLF